MFRNTLNGSYLLYASTILLSAFLLFAVQPIAGKHLLPWFGGSSSVWATSLLFFTSLLFVGYLYVFLLTRYGGQRQAQIHAMIVFLGTSVALISYLGWGSLFPPLLAIVGADAPPAQNLLVALLIALGAPYFLLSTTGPLLQYWYGTSSHNESSGQSPREPYKLYALSNFGSLLALVLYPFAIEPAISLVREEQWWMWLFFLYALLCALVCVAAYRLRHAVVATSETLISIAPTRIFIWTALAALPAFLLVASTTHLTQVIAPVPLLWVLPLMLYLVTFILAFAGRGSSIFVPLLWLLSVIAAYWYIPYNFGDIVLQIGSSLLVLFFAGLACHAKLYEMRPPTGQLPLFYVLVSFGGMLGTLCASLIAPLIFPDFWEFPLGIALSAVVAAALLSELFFPRILNNEKIRLLRVAFAIFSCILFLQVVLDDDAIPTISSRNFYGNVQVRFDEDTTRLMHGTTLHGTQYNAQKWANIPTTYYSETSGAGLSIREAQMRQGERGVRVAVVGLGTGTIASYCRPGDTYVFYEIDARVQDIATKYFSYLSHCKDAEVRIGDGRILLEHERADGQLGAYDVILVDAFSDDTIPVHLMTAQAVDLYRVHLRGESGIIAVHTSNRYLDLPPIVMRIALALGLNATVIQDEGGGPGASSSQWVLLTPDGSIFASSVFKDANSWLPEPSEVLWTDDFTSILHVLDVPLPWAK